MSKAKKIKRRPASVPAKLRSRPGDLPLTKLKRLAEERHRLLAEHHRLLAQRARFFPGEQPQSADPKQAFKEMTETFITLQELCHRYTDLFDFAPVGYVALDGKGQIREVNQTGLRLLGRGYAELINQFMTGLVVREDAAQLLSHLRRCKNSRGNVSTELRLRQKAGPPLPVELLSACGKNPADDFTEYRTAIIDLTGRRRMEAALQQIQQNYHTLIDSIEGLVWEGRASGRSWRFIFVSRQAETLLGYPRPRWTMEQDFWLHRLHPEDRSRVRAVRDRALAEGKDHVLEYRLIDAHRRAIWVRDSVVVAKAADGALRLRGIMINISELKEMETALRGANSELEARVEHRTAALARACLELHTEIMERKRLEDDLLELTESGRRQEGIDFHGQVAQNLAGVAFMLKSLGLKLERISPPEAGQAERIQSLVDQTIAHTRDPTQDLVSFGMQAATLPTALKGLAARAEDLLHVRCLFKPNGALPPLDQDVVTQVYNIAQESLVNAIRHGEARRVVIALGRKNDRLSLTVEHDGHAFPTPLHHSLVLGMKIMNYRANLIGASLKIAEPPEHGATVTCIFPAKTKEEPRLQLPNLPPLRHKRGASR